jgi:hypothetical protein
MFGVKKNGVTREGRKLHKRSLSIRSPHPIFFGVTKSRIIRWAGHIARMGQKRDLCRVLVGKTEGKRTRHRWEDNIKMELQEVGCGGIKWFEMAQMVGTCECGKEPSGYIKCVEFPNQLKTAKLLRKDSAP